MRAFIAVILLGGTAIAAPKGKPKLEYGDPAVSGAADATAVTKVIKGSSAKLLGCYKKALVLKPDLYGTATATFTIAADGKVSTADTVGLAVSVGACIAATITKLRFAKPLDGQPVKVTYPLTFDPGTESSESPRLVGISASTQSRPLPVPKVSLGVVAVQGGHDKAIIRRIIKRNIQKLQYCYEKGLLENPTLKGTVISKFTIGVDGLVTASTSSGMGNPSIESCVAGVIKVAEFPKPKGNGTVTVTYPLTFQPAS